MRESKSLLSELVRVDFDVTVPVNGYRLFVDYLGRIVAEFPGCFEPNLNGEPVSKRFSLVKESENVALTLHYVQPQEYIEYFEDSVITSLRAKFEFDAEIGRNGVF